MKLPVVLGLLLSLAAPFSSLQAAHPVLCCDYGGNKVCVVSASGRIEWEYSCKNPQDCWRLPNGNYLFCHLGGALEVTPEKKIVWEYKALATCEVHACQPLPNGRVLVAEGGPARIVEVDRAGKVAKEIKLMPSEKLNKHEQVRGARKGKDGHYYVCFKGDHKVVELNSDGRVLREIKAPGDVHEVVPLARGHLLITCGDGHKVMEIDSKEKVIWEINENDLPGHPLRLMAGCQRLPNGNTLLCNYLGHGHLKQQAQVIEVTPDKKVVWEIADHDHFNSINQIQALDVRGDVTKGKVTR